MGKIVRIADRLARKKKQEHKGYKLEYYKFPDDRLAHLGFRSTDSIVCYVSKFVNGALHVVSRGKKNLLRYVLKRRKCSGGGPGDKTIYRLTGLDPDYPSGEYSRSEFEAKGYEIKGYAEIVPPEELTSYERPLLTIGDLSTEVRKETYEIVTWQTDKLGRTVKTSENWYRITGSRPEDVIGSTSYLLGLHPDDEPRFMAAWGQGFSEDTFGPISYRYRIADGSYVSATTEAKRREDKSGWDGTTKLELKIK